MANINLYDAYLSKLRKFGVNDSSRFQGSFVDAVNNVYAEMNDQVFQAETLSMIDSFDDIVDNRLEFTSLTFDAAANTAISGNEFWTAEWEIERRSDTNGMTDTITDDASNVVFTILNGVFSVAGSNISASYTLDDADSLAIKFISDSEGNHLYVNGEEKTMTYTTGAETDTQSIGTVSAHVINGFTGLSLKRLRFLTPETLTYEFLINEGTGSTLTDEVNSYDITVVGGSWEKVYVEPSSSLSSRYKSPFDMGLDYHLQDGGEWAIEPESERERKWYGRGIRQARNIYQQTTTYSNPLGI